MEQQDGDFIRSYMKAQQLEFEVELGVSDVRVALASGIMYGRQNPNREMLKRFAQYMYDNMTIYLSAPDGENIVVDEFLKLEETK